MPSTLPSTLPGTRTEWVDARLRSEILAGELPPGTPLRVEELAQRWSVSPTPVREALQRLAGIGFVELRPQKGARVAPATLQDVEEVYELRLLLEPVALRESLDRADDEFRAGVDEAYRQYALVMQSGEDAIATLFDAHRSFHASLLTRCPNARMLAVVSGLAEHAQRFQLSALGAPGGHHDVVSEHRTLCDHALTGRVDEAVAFLTDHLRATLDGARVGRVSEEEFVGYQS